MPNDNDWKSQYKEDTIPLGFKRVDFLRSFPATTKDAWREKWLPLWTRRWLPVRYTNLETIMEREYLREREILSEMVARLRKKRCDS